MTFTKANQEWDGIFMKTLTLKNKFQTNATLLPNDFIDHYMIDANGEFVKVYLFLLRHLDDPCSSLTLTAIADCLNNTETDILRAFRYWEKEGLLRLEYDGEGKIIGLELQKTAACSSSAASESVPSEKTSETLQRSGRRTEEAAPELPAHDSVPANAVPLDAFRAQKEIRSLLFIAEQYLGKTLTHTDMETITYFYETLHMSASLIEYLLESCVESGHKSMHYIRKVAFSWVEAGITSISQAKEHSALYNRNCYTVLNAFGIKSRGPASSELAYIKKWTEEYGFSCDIVEEACRRTISATHQPSFEYADSILTKWKEKNIRHLADIAPLDEAYMKERSAVRAAAKSRQLSKNLNNFERRSYDMNSLEEQLLNSN